MPRVLVIIGSVRPQRIGPAIAQWVAEIGRSTISATLAVADLRDWPLPMDDEPDIPARGGYVQSHTKAWSAEVNAADAFVFLTPQYNWGYPAPLKNAIDHLYSEWRGKPAAIITYGGHGGGKCAAQLREVLSGLKMRIAERMPALVLPEGQVEGNTGTIDPDTAFKDDRAFIEETFNQLQALLAANQQQVSSGKPTAI